MSMSWSSSEMNLSAHCGSSVSGFIASPTLTSLSVIYHESHQKLDSSHTSACTVIMSLPAST